MTALTEHDRHVIDRVFIDGCDECQRDADAVDWLLEYGIPYDGPPTVRRDRSAGSGW